MPRRRSPLLLPIDQGGVAHEPALPLPYVEYPGDYQTFFRFAEGRSAPFVFCECARVPLRNAARIRVAFPDAPIPGRPGEPESLLRDAGVSDRVLAMTKGCGVDGIDGLAFVPGVCHRCAKATPTSFVWCHEMYGTPWMQAYGWYVRLAAFECGMNPHDFSQFIPDAVPSDMLPDVADYMMANAACLTLTPTESAQHESPALRKRAQAAKTRVQRRITSVARLAFGFKAVGDGWVSETLLFQLVQALLPPTRLIRHDRPDWLEGLELDLHAPLLGVGIEYQGAQHERPVERWGGVAALDRQQARDARKRALCRAEGVNLIEIWHTTLLTRPTVAAILRDAGVPLRAGGTG